FMLVRSGSAQTAQLAKFCASLRGFAAAGSLLRECEERLADMLGCSGREILFPFELDALTRSVSSMLSAVSQGYPFLSRDWSTLRTGTAEPQTIAALARRLPLEVKRTLLKLATSDAPRTCSASKAIADLRRLLRRREAGISPANFDAASPRRLRISFIGPW